MILKFNQIKNDKENNKTNTLDFKKTIAKKIKRKQKNIRTYFKKYREKINYF